MLQKRIDDQPSISPEMVREAQGILHQHLKKVGLNRRRSAKPSCRTFLETREHLSTDELHRLVKKKDPKIGYTTVYRTLKLLAECGLASEVAFHDGIAPLRASVQPAQPPPHGLHGLRQLGRVLLE